jgi:malonyl-CoA decarboxylase
MRSLMKLFRFRKQEPDPARTSKREVRRAITLCQRLLDRTGEAGAVKTAGEVIELIRSFDSDARTEFLDALAAKFCSGGPELQRAAQAYSADPSPKNLALLQAGVESPCMKLFQSLNAADGATPTLVELRSWMLDSVTAKLSWLPVSEDLRRLFDFWFNRGFLILERIHWQTPASVLERLIHYEAVHQIQGFPDLRRRLEADRRCYAFFHPAMPGEPLVFVEIALTKGASSTIGPLLDSASPVSQADHADSAVFYSITNCQAGLRGVPFGSFLIKQVVDDLRQDLPGLRRFVTLSPIPGFRGWLSRQPEYARLKPALEGGAWGSNSAESSALEPVLTSLCAYYLLKVKKGDEPLDPVARFHLRNGASLDRINWKADLSERAMESSFGMMVNYAYRPREIEFNHERYVTRHKIAAGSKINSMAKRGLSAAELLPTG